jgi:hypothetical protein
VTVTAVKGVGLGALSLAGVTKSNPGCVWMSVSNECCLLSCRGPCIGIITPPDESYQVCSVSECDRQASTMSKPLPTRGCPAVETKCFISIKLQLVYIAMGLRILQQCRSQFKILGARRLT